MAQRAKRSAAASVAQEKGIVALVLLVCCLILIVANPSNSGLAILLGGPTTAVQTGDVVQIDVTAESVNDLSGAQLSISYDPNLLTFDRVEEGDFLNEGGAAPTYAPVAAADTTVPGEVKDIIILRTDGQGRSGTGTLARVYFTAAANGLADVDFSKVLFSDSQGSAISEPTAGTTVQIGSGTGQPPTFLNIPSKQVLAGDTLTVTINANGISDLAGVQFTLDYDPSILSFSKRTEGGFISEQGTNTPFAPPPTTTTPGVVGDLIILRTDGQGSSGSGNIVSIDFIAKASGTPTLRLSQFILSDSNAAPIPNAHQRLTFTTTVAGGGNPTGCTTNSDCQSTIACGTDIPTCEVQTGTCFCSPGNGGGGTPSVVNDLQATRDASGLITLSWTAPNNNMGGSVDGTAVLYSNTRSHLQGSSAAYITQGACGALTAVPPGTRQSCRILAGELPAASYYSDVYLVLEPFVASTGATSRSNIALAGGPGSEPGEDICPTVLCAAPPEGCHYRIDSTAQCPGCGELVCPGDESGDEGDSCSCGSYQDLRCGGEGCGANQMAQYRSCTPQACAQEVICVTTSACGGSEDGEGSHEEEPGEGEGSGEQPPIEDDMPPQEEEPDEGSGTLIQPGQTFTLRSGEQTVGPVTYQGISSELVQFRYNGGLIESNPYLGSFSLILQGTSFPGTIESGGLIRMPGATITGSEEEQPPQEEEPGDVGGSEGGNDGSGGETGGEGGTTVQCVQNSDCGSQIVCPQVVGSDTPLCNLNTNTCYCGGSSTPPISGSSVQVVPGQDVYVDFMLGAHTAVSGIQFDISYPANLLQFNSITEGNVIGMPADTFSPDPTTNNPGLVQNVIFLRTDGVGVSTSGGSVGVAHFVATGTGVATIGVPKMILSNAQGSAITGATLTPVIQGATQPPTTPPPQQPPAEQPPSGEQPPVEEPPQEETPGETTPPPTTPPVSVVGTQIQTPVTPGANIMIEVHANNVMGMAGTQFDVTYPPNLLQLQSVSEGTFLSENGLYSPFFPKNSIDTSTPGQVNKIVILRTDGGSVSGSGELAVLHFTGIGTGTATIDLPNIIFSDTSAQKIPLAGAVLLRQTSDATPPTNNVPPPNPAPPTTCGTDDQCFIAASATCKDASYADTTTIDAYGLLADVQVDMQLAGMQGSDCVLEFTFSSFTLRYDPADRAALNTRGISDADIDAALALENAEAQTVLGQVNTCLFDPSNLPTYLSGTLDVPVESVAQCSGSIFTQDFIIEYDDPTLPSDTGDSDDLEEITPEEEASKTTTRKKTTGGNRRSASRGIGSISVGGVVYKKPVPSFSDFVNTNAEEERSAEPQTTRYAYTRPRAGRVSGVSLTLATDVGAPSVSVSEDFNTPTSTDLREDANIFKTFRLNPSNFNTRDISEATITFTVDDAWMNENGVSGNEVVVYAKGQDDSVWTRQTASSVGTTASGETEYSVTVLEDIHTFAIGSPDTVFAPTPTPIPQQTQTDTSPSYQLAEDTEPQTSGFPWMWLVGFGLIIAVGVLASIALHKYGMPSFTHAKKASGGINPIEHEKLRAYYNAMKGKGKNNAEIKDSLLRAGWPQSTVEAFLKQQA